MQVRRENDPVVRAEQMLVARAPLAALAELDKLSDSPRSKSAQVQVVRGKAEHALGQLGMAFADFAAALDADYSVADPHVMRAHALLARTAAENRRCGSREASDALRRLDRAKGQPAGAPQSGAPPTNHSGPAAAAAMPSATSVVPIPSAAHPVKKISKTKTKKKHRRKP